MIHSKTMKFVVINTIEGKEVVLNPAHMTSIHKADTAYQISLDNGDKYAVSRQSYVSVCAALNVVVKPTPEEEAQMMRSVAVHNIPRY